MKRIYIVILLLLLTFINWGQANLISRKWNYHLSNIQTFDVVKGEKRIYFLSKGSIYYYNQQDNSINTITKIEGLSGSDFEGMDYSFDTKSLIVYYTNSMIDIVPDEGKIIAISDIYRKGISGDKKIYNATCHNGLCYLACGFGIVVLDIANRQIKDSFIIGDYGNYQAVFDIALDDEFIYAGTMNGIKQASLNALNLNDFAYWNYVEHKAIEYYNFDILTHGAGRIWAVHKSFNQWHMDKTFSRHGADIWFNEYPEIAAINSIKVNGKDVVYTGEANLDTFSTVCVYRINEGIIHNITQYPFMLEGLKMDPRSAIIDNEGTIWIADKNYGGIRVKDGVFTQLTPTGPIDNDAFSISFSNGKLWVAKGGHDAKWDGIGQPATIQSLINGKWDYFNRYTHPELNGVFDIVQVLPFPGEPNHIYACTWGNGILEFKDGKLINIYNQSNSTLRGVNETSSVRIGGMAFDSDGNLWVTNSEVKDVLHMKTPGGKWESFNLPEIANSYKIGKVMVTSKNQVWITIPRNKTNGLYVMDIDTKRKRHLNVIRLFTNGEEVDKQDMNNVFDIVEDKEGIIWVGTSLGIAVYDNPENVFDKEEYYAKQPGVKLNDFIYHPLLQTETVTAIAVDGGNQKWCGTRNSGVYLISEDGTKEIKHFDTDNPDADMISNKITCLAYDENGTLYVGSDLGLISFYTDAVKPFEHFANVYAYPNPVDRLHYQGDIFITGLMAKSNVKITSVSGKLVYETTSIGGQAVWDGKDLDGNTVHTGVYLVFCASEEGEESAVTKIAFIR